MATLKNFEIVRNWGKKDHRICNMAWDTELEEGEMYDLVKISINEINNYYWNVSIGVKCGTTEEEIKQAVESYVKTITNEEIKDYNKFLAYGEKWGWD